LPDRGDRLVDDARRREYRRPNVPKDPYFAFAVAAIEASRECR